ncbi:GIY-YIG nuclease family protein [Croceitalea sp. MTPC5]|uniref:GIY-YIG nuclease family protein n=1 Tax=Croceitalea sp. MTPC5 TaxID=3056565 RepID=UPI0030CF1CE8
MSHFLYIIHSEKVSSYYVGETHDLMLRLERHNTHVYKKGFTKMANDWRIVLSKECKTKEEAVYLEGFIKRMKSRKFIEKVISDRDILDDILSKR